MLIYYNIKKIIFLFVLFFILFGIQVLLVVFSLFRRRVYYFQCGYLVLQVQYFFPHFRFCCDGSLLKFLIIYYSKYKYLKRLNLTEN